MIKIHSTRDTDSHDMCRRSFDMGDCMSFCAATDQQDQQLISQVVVLQAGQSDVIDFHVDSTANSDLTVAIGYTAATAPDVSLLTPVERQITATSSEYRVEPSFQTIYISLGDAAEASTKAKL